MLLLKPWEYTCNWFGLKLIHPGRTASPLFFPLRTITNKYTHKKLKLLPVGNNPEPGRTTQKDLRVTPTH